jgi:ribosomal protein L40E
MIEFGLAVLERPGSMLGCFAFIPVAIWTVSMVGWMITGEVEPLFGIAAIGTGIMVGLFAFVAPVPGMEPYFLLAALGMVIFYPLVRAGLTKRELVQVDIDGMRRCYEMLEERPNAFASQFKLARLCWERGLPHPAVALAEQAIAHMPVQHFRDEHRALASWKASLMHQQPAQPIPCLECNTDNPPGVIHCQRCRHRFLLDAAQGKYVGKSAGRKLIAGWISLTSLLLLVPLTLSALPPLAALMVVVMICLACAGLLVFAFRTQPAA